MGCVPVLSGLLEQFLAPPVGPVDVVPFAHPARRVAARRANVSAAPIFMRPFYPAIGYNFRHSCRALLPG